MAAPNFPTNTPPSNISIVDDWLLGDSRVVWLAKFAPIKLSTSSAVTKYAHIGRKRNPNLTGSTPRLLLPSLQISIIDAAFGTRQEDVWQAVVGQRGGQRSFGVNGGRRIQYEQFRAGQLEVGGFELINVDGDLDNWETDFSWADTEVLVQIGLDTDALASFKTILPMKIRNAPTWSTAGNLMFGVKGSGVNLNATPQTATFAGTGGLEGGADLKGKTKPYLIGKQDNIRPVLVDYATQKYLVDPDGVSVGGTVYEHGLGVGSAATWDTANGWFTLNNEGELITCDATAKDRRSVGATAHELGENFHTVLTEFAGAAAPGKAGLAYDGGLYLEAGGSPTYEEVLTQLSKPGIYFPNQDASQLLLGEIGAPEDGTAVYTYTDKHIESIERVDSAPPAWDLRIGYRELGYVHDSVLPSVSGVERARLTQPRRHDIDTDTTVLIDYMNALAVDMWTSLYDLADATTVAGALGPVLNVFRGVYKVKMLRHPLQAWIGDVISIDFPRYGFDGGKQVMVTGWSVDFESRAFVMEVWG